MSDIVTQKAPRTCPSCGSTTDLRFCPHDGTATVEGRALFADPTALRAGDVVNGRYRITELIGRGGFGAVYAGEHTGTHQEVALKLLMPSDDDPKTDIRRFHQEAELTASLRHPNTVRVFDVGQTQHGALFLAMELLQGQTLEDRLQALEAHRLPLPQEEALDLAIQTLKALSEAHGKGLVHRDLKPANLMLTEFEGDRLIKVLDFGIARREGSTLTGRGRALGTPAYMSPEQCMGDEVDGRADLYALACILFRCLTGRTPFEAETALQMMQGHALAPVPDVALASRLPVAPGLKSAIERALAKNAKERFQSAREMRATLEIVKSTLVPDDEAPTLAWDTRPKSTVQPGASLRAAAPAPIPKPKPVTLVPPTPSVNAAASAWPIAPPKAAPAAKTASAAAAWPVAPPSPSPAAPPAAPPAVRAPAKPTLTVVADAPKKRAQAAAPARSREDEYAPLPKPGLPTWLPWAIGAGVVAAVVASFLLWR